MRLPEDRVERVTPPPTPTKSTTVTVEQAKTAGATGDYSQLNKIIKDPAAYDAFKEARLDRFESARIAAAPQKPATVPPPPPPPPPTYEPPKQRQEEPPSYPTVSPVPMTPSITAAAVAITPPPPPVKTAPIDTILFDEEAVPVQIMADLIFENIGGQELINIARNDTINGQNIIYQPIKNLTQIQQQYNPNNIVSLQATSDKYFQNFSIKFDNKVPDPGTGPGGEHIYIEPATGDLVVEAVNLDIDEQIEIEITLGGTIYEADI